MRWRLFLFLQKELGGSDLNKGKVFEQEWRKSSENQNLLIIRLADSDMSFNPNKELRSRFTVQQPCDYIMHYNGHIVFLEMKSTHFKSVSFQRDKQDGGMIQLHQINSLVNLAQYEGALAGFVFNFRNEKEGTPYTEDTYYMSIEDFSAFYNSSDKKSINKLDIVQNGGIIVDAKQRKKLYNYNVKKMLEDIVAQREET